MAKGSSARCRGPVRVSCARAEVRRAASSRRHVHGAARGCSHHGAVATLRDALRSLAGFYKTRSRHAAYPGQVVCPKDRSGVGCSHREGCPLFPLLNASLRGWRDYYCDSADRWHDCARYKLSRTGQLVPITLLPNGHDAQLLRSDRGADRSGPAEPAHAPSQAPPSQVKSGSPETAVPMARFEPGPAPTRLLEPSPPSEVPQPLESPPAVPQTPGRPPARTRPARRTHGSTRRWWTRLTDWMTSPA